MARFPRVENYAAYFHKNTYLTTFRKNYSASFKNSVSINSFSTVEKIKTGLVKKSKAIKDVIDYRHGATDWEQIKNSEHRAQRRLGNHLRWLRSGKPYLNCGKIMAANSGGLLLWKRLMNTTSRTIRTWSIFIEFCNKMRFFQVQRSCN